MVNRAKYFQMAASSLDTAARAFTTIAKNKDDLYKKEAQTELELKYSDFSAEVERIRLNIDADKSINPDKMEEVWQKSFTEAKRGVTQTFQNELAKEYFEKESQILLNQSTGQILLASNQRRADNIVNGINTSLSKLITEYKSTDDPEMVIRKAKLTLGIDPMTGKSIGWQDRDNGGIIPPVFSQAEADRLLEAFTKDIYLTDTEKSIDAFLLSDATSGGKTGYQRAKDLISDNQYGLNENDKKELGNYLSTEYNSIMAKRSQEADSFNQGAVDTFLPRLADTTSPITVDEILDYYDGAAIPIDVENEKVQWLQTVYSQEDNRALSNIYQRINQGEEIAPEELEAFHYPLSEEEKAIILSKPDSAPISAGTAGGTSSTSSSAAPKSAEFIGVNTSSASAILELDRLKVNPNIDDDNYRRMVASYSKELSPDDLAGYMNFSRANITNPAYKRVYDYIEGKFEDYWKNMDEPATYGQIVAKDQLNSMVLNAINNNPSMLENEMEYMATVERLWLKDYVGKKIKTEFGKITDLRNGGQNLEKDLKNIDSFEVFLDMVNTGSFEGMISNTMMQGYLNTDLTMEIPELMDYFSNEMWGVPYGDIEFDPVMKNLTDINVVYAAHLPLLKDLYETEVVPALGEEYNSRITQHGVVFVTPEGVAVRAVTEEGRGKAEVWQFANIGKDYYQGESRLPSDIVWQPAGFTRLFEAKKALNAKSQTAEEEIRAEQRRNATPNQYVSDPVLESLGVEAVQSEPIVDEETGAVTAQDPIYIPGTPQPVANPITNQQNYSKWFSIENAAADMEKTFNTVKNGGKYVLDVFVNLWKTAFTPRSRADVAIEELEKARMEVRQAEERITFDALSAEEKSWFEDWLNDLTEEEAKRINGSGISGSGTTEPQNFERNQ